jgi:hypothetical protein
MFLKMRYCVRKLKKKLIIAVPGSKRIIQYHMIKDFNEGCLNGLAQPPCFVRLLIRTSEKYHYQ